MLDRRIRSATALASRFGWVRTGSVALLWIARQMIGYRQALIYRLDLDFIPVLRGCEELHWFYAEDPPAVGTRTCSRRTFVGTLRGVQCYVSVVCDSGFEVPDRASVAFSAGTDCYVGDCSTVPEHRGKGIYPCGLVQLAHELRAAGKRALYLFVERENLASDRSVRKAGFVPVAACSVWHLWKWAGRRWRPLTNRGDWMRSWTVDTDLLPHTERSVGERL